MLMSSETSNSRRSAPSYPPQMRRASISGSPSACKAENKAREEAKMNLLREVNRGPSLRGDAAKSLFLASG